MPSHHDPYALQPYVTLSPHNIRRPARPFLRHPLVFRENFVPSHRSTSTVFREEFDHSLRITSMDLTIDIGRSVLHAEWEATQLDAHANYSA